MRGFFIWDLVGLFEEWFWRYVGEFGVGERIKWERDVFFFSG